MATESPQKAREGLLERSLSEQRPIRCVEADGTVSLLLPVPVLHREWVLWTEDAMTGHAVGYASARNLCMVCEPDVELMDVPFPVMRALPWVGE